MIENFINNIPEIWKDIKEYESLYQVSNHGRIKSLKFGKERILKPGKDKDGYLLVLLWKNGLRRTYKVHHLVLEAFVGPRPFKYTITRHLDNIKSNNCSSNLKWGSSKENHDDQIKHNTYLIKARGSKHGISNLNEEKVRIIKRLLEDGYLTIKEIAEIFKVVRSAIYDIKNNKTWKHVK